MDIDKVETILRIPSPKNVRQIIGFRFSYRRIIPSFSTQCDPLTRLTRKNVPFNWNEHEEALNSLKQHLVSAPILAYPDFNIPFIVETDVFDFGLGVVLIQNKVSKKRSFAIKAIISQNMKESVLHLRRNVYLYFLP